MAAPVFQRPGAGVTVDNPVGGSVIFKLRGGESGARLTAFESVVGPGEGPPLHTHANEDETLYVLEGRVRFKLGGEIETGGAGSFAFAPRGVPHAFQNVGDAPARLLIHFSPSGMERFFEAFTAEGSDPAAFARLGEGVGMAVAGPPLTASDPR